MSNQENKITVKEDSLIKEQEFSLIQRQAIALSKSTIIPKGYQGNLSNVMVALELSNRIGSSPLAVMQSLDVINGKPSWSGQFIISILNSCKRFKSLRYKKVGKEGAASYGIVATAISLEDNELLEGVPVTWEMVNAEGWAKKPGSKWKTMPELMFRYRAATFFGRLYAPDLLNGMSIEGEEEDISSVIESGDKWQELEKKWNDLKAYELNEKTKEKIDKIVSSKNNLNIFKIESYLEKLENNG